MSKSESTNHHLWTAVYSCLSHASAVYPLDRCHMPSHQQSFGAIYQGPYPHSCWIPALDEIFTLPYVHVLYHNSTNVISTKIKHSPFKQIGGYQKPYRKTVKFLDLGHGFTWVQPEIGYVLNPVVCEWCLYGETRVGPKLHLQKRDAEVMCIALLSW